MSQAVPYSSIEPQLRIYNEAIARWLKSGPVRDDGKQPYVVYARPEKAFAAMRHILSGESGGSSVDDRNIPLPFISLDRKTLRFDQTRFFGHRNVITKVSYSEDFRRTASLPPPKPYNIEYQVEIWARTIAAAEAYSLWLQGCFESFELLLPVNVSSVWSMLGTKLLPIVNEGMIDNTDIESSDEARVVRHTHRFVARAWIFSMPVVSTTVLETKIDVHMPPTGVPIDVDVTVVDANPLLYPKVIEVDETAEEFLEELQA